MFRHLQNLQLRQLVRREGGWAAKAGHLTRQQDRTHLVDRYPSILPICLFWQARQFGAMAEDQIKSIATALVVGGGTLHRLAAPF